ncbi:MAG: class A beta-lactamase-related serine hydrolase [Bacillota bacterium]|nr:class A beta-lactamase-related serine hydrolase [Bacillota bacterium]
MKKFKNIFFIIALGSLLFFSVHCVYNESEPSFNPVSYDTFDDTYSVLVSSGKSGSVKKLISSRNKERERTLQLYLLQRKIENYLGSKIKKIGLVYYDFSTKETIEINGDKVFFAASTIKVPVNMVYYNMAAEKKINLSQKLSYSKADYEDGTGILKNLKKINPIEIQTLLDYSIIYSDNIAVNMLIRNIGHDNIKLHFNKIIGDIKEHKLNDTTPKEMMKYLQFLFTNPDKNLYYEHLIDVMKQTSFHDRLDKYIPEMLTAHKIGNYCKIIKGKGYDYVNDIGIIYTDKPYAITVYTENMNNANEVIAEISKMVYDYQIKK